MPLINKDRLYFITRYLISGGISYLIYVAILLIGRLVPQLPIYLSLIGGTAFLIASFANYILHYFYTYRSSTPHKNTIVKFTSIVLLGSLGLIGLIMVLTPLVSQNVLLLIEMIYAIVWPLISATLLTLFVFRKPS